MLCASPFTFRPSHLYPGDTFPLNQIHANAPPLLRNCQLRNTCAIRQHPDGVGCAQMGDGRRGEEGDEGDLMAEGGEAPTSVRELGEGEIALAAQAVDGGLKALALGHEACALARLLAHLC